jgi:DNA-binding NarL/FixJ family response regulator
MILGKSVKILLSETQYLVKQGLVNLIKEVPEFEPAGSISGISELIYGDGLPEFDVLIVDKNFGDFFIEENIEVTSELFKSLKVLVISDSDKESIYKIHKLNITGFITIESDKYEIIDAIKKTAEGTKFFSPKIVEALIAMSYGMKREAEQNLTKKQESAPQNLLSEREKEVLKLVVKGKSAQEMADELFLSIHTVYTHRKNILKKLSCKNATELLNYAMSKGLIESN